MSKRRRISNEISFSKSYTEPEPRDYTWKEVKTDIDEYYAKFERLVEHETLSKFVDTKQALDEALAFCLDVSTQRLPVVMRDAELQERFAIGIANYRTDKARNLCTLCIELTKDIHKLPEPQRIFIQIFWILTPLLDLQFEPGHSQTVKKFARSIIDNYKNRPTKNQVRTELEKLPIKTAFQDEPYQTERRLTFGVTPTIPYYEVRSGNFGNTKVDMTDEQLESARYRRSPQFGMKTASFPCYNE